MTSGLTIDFLECESESESESGESEELLDDDEDEDFLLSESDSLSEEEESESEESDASVELPDSELELLASLESSDSGRGTLVGSISDSLSEESVEESESEPELEAELERGDGDAFFLEATFLDALLFFFTSGSASESLLDSLLESLSELLLELPLELLMELPLELLLLLLEPLLELELELLLEPLLESLSDPLSESLLDISSVSTSMSSAGLCSAALFSHVLKTSSKLGWGVSSEIPRFFDSASSLRAASGKPLFWRRSRMLVMRAAGGCLEPGAAFFWIFCFFSGPLRAVAFVPFAIVLDLDAHGGSCRPNIAGWSRNGGSEV